MPKSTTNDIVLYPGALGRSISSRASLITEMQDKFERQKKDDELLKKQMIILAPRGLKRYVEEEVLTLLFQYGKCDDKIYFRNGDNSGYGFGNLEDVKKKIASLKKAWNKVVRIELRESEEHRVQVVFKAII